MLTIPVLSRYIQSFALALNGPSQVDGGNSSLGLVGRPDTKLSETRWTSQTGEFNVISIKFLWLFGTSFYQKLENPFPTDKAEENHFLFPNGLYPSKHNIK